MSRHYRFSQKDFSAIRSLVYEKAGISLSTSKDAMVYSRLSRRLRALSITTFSEYLSYLTDNEAEMQRFIDALTTNKTAFFREEHHFSFLRQWFSKQSQPVKIWCAACSSGEEPYSVAMTCEHVREPAGADFMVYASDINVSMLDKAKSGRYPIDMLDKIPQEYIKPFCQKGKNSNAGQFRIHPSVYAKTRFFQQNLLSQDWSLPEHIDVIFCRNAMIYFDKKTQSELLNRFSQRLKAGGLYFAGHSESVLPLCDNFVSLGHTIYQKVS